MYAQHIEGSLIGPTYEESGIDVKTIYFGSGNKEKAEKKVIAEYNDMKNRGFINVCIVAEDENGNFAQPLMLDNNSKLTPFIQDMSCEQIKTHWHLSYLH